MTLHTIPQRKLPDRIPARPLPLRNLQIVGVHLHQPLHLLILRHDVTNLAAVHNHTVLARVFAPHNLHVVARVE